MLLLIPTGLCICPFDENYSFPALFFIIPATEPRFFLARISDKLDVSEQLDILQRTGFVPIKAIEIKMY